MLNSGIRLLLADNDPMIKEMLPAVLSQANYKVRVAHDISTIKQLVHEFSPQIAIVDLNNHGLAVAQRINCAGDVPVIYLTQNNSMDEIVEALNKGGHDCISKPFSSQELVARVNAMARCYDVKAKLTAEVGGIILDEATYYATRYDNVVSLRKREFQILVYFAKHAGVILPKERIIQGVFDSQFYTANVIEVHVSLLRKKLEKYGPRVIHTVRDVGYIYRD